MAESGQMLDKFIKLPDYQKLIALGVLIVLLGVGYYFGIHKDKVIEYNDKKAELEKLEAKHSEQQRVLANIEHFRQELRVMQAKFQEALKQLPNSSEIPALLSNISSLAQESGLEIQLFKPSAEIAKGFYADIPVEVEVKGNYHDIGYFFDKVAKLDRIVNIENISMKANKRRQTRGAKLDTRLTSKFRVVTFKFIDEVKSTGDAKGRKGKRKRKTPRK
jgi:type IV pilus assembly protein PilO